VVREVKMSDDFKLDSRKMVLDDLKKMDELCGWYDYDWTAVLTQHLYTALEYETEHGWVNEQSTYYKSVLLRDFFTSGDFEFTLGIMADAFKLGDVKQLLEENSRLRAELKRIADIARAVEGDPRAEEAQ
jgi:hypothetical protein